MLRTRRLILQKWKESDAEDLYEAASNPDVGPIAGWPPHKSIDERGDVIENVLNGKRHMPSVSKRMAGQSAQLN